ncbi:hypothetical protein ALC57_13091 [Trachymyrmex cornetzi]|uniref:Uncharacterized protein n=1 Tax=Trachymyrmex cornetzi TaxID=471704 RepID=A0A195DPD8_9HYME|nr:hypothetical protein ALC57_13091 [Trachymyrmex cornetzi]
MHLMTYISPRVAIWGPFCPASIYVAHGKSCARACLLLLLLLFLLHHHHLLTPAVVIRLSRSITRSVLRTLPRLRVSPPHATTPARSQCPDKKRCPLKLLRARLPSSYRETRASLHLQIFTRLFSYRFLTEEKGRPRATSMSMLKRYQNQSIICNNGFLKTTFHKPPPGGHVVSPLPVITVHLTPSAQRHRYYRLFAITLPQVLVNKLHARSRGASQAFGAGGRIDSRDSR